MVMPFELFALMILEASLLEVIKTFQETMGVCLEQQMFRLPEIATGPVF